MAFGDFVPSSSANNSVLDVSQIYDGKSGRTSATLRAPNQSKFLPRTKSLNESASRQSVNSSAAANLEGDHLNRLDQMISHEEQ